MVDQKTCEIMNKVLGLPEFATIIPELTSNAEPLLNLILHVTCFIHIFYPRLIPSSF